jgi:uridine kinase
MTQQNTSSSCQPFVVGIAGGSAAGKSTFSTTLRALLAQGSPALRVEYFGMDRYFFRGEPGPRFISPSTGALWTHNNHPDSADNARLVADLDARCRAEDAPDVIIVEGLMTLAIEAIRSRLDLRLFVELDADQRALRRLLRDMAGARGNADPQFIVTYYNECARVGHARYVEPSRVHADLILRGDADFQRTAPMVAAIIRDKTRRVSGIEK